jgi:predicted ATP-grasp superfamily ATP-dependent carboligase
VSSILIIGTYRHTLTVIRSVARAGNRVILGIHRDAEACEYSRYVDEIWWHPKIESNHDQFILELNRYLLNRPDITKIFPVGETELRLFSDKYGSVPSHVRLLMCNPETIRICLYKPAMFAIVDELEIPQARYATVSDSNSLFAASDSIGYPCVVKPTSSDTQLFAAKAVIYETAARIREDLSLWPTENQSLVVQEYVPSPRHNMYFFSNDGRIEALAEVRILRTDRLDGTGMAVSGVTVIPNPVLVGYCQKIAMRLNYQGAACIQFLVDDANVDVSFLELNPRLGANFAIVYRAGLDLPLMMINTNFKKKTNETSSEYVCKEGVHYTWTTGDLTGLRNAIIDGRVGIRGTFVWLLAMIKSNFTSSVHVTWDWRDPLPTIVSFSRLFASFLIHLIPSRSKKIRKNDPE